MAGAGAGAVGALLFAVEGGGSWGRKGGRRIDPDGAWLTADEAVTRDESRRDGRTEKAPPSPPRTPARRPSFAKRLLEKRAGGVVGRLYRRVAERRRGVREILLTSPSGPPRRETVSRLYIYAAEQLGRRCGRAVDVAATRVSCTRACTRCRKSCSEFARTR